jgi:hypothetical protein
MQIDLFFTLSNLIGQNMIQGIVLYYQADRLSSLKLKIQVVRYNRDRK